MDIPFTSLFFIVFLQGPDVKEATNKTRVSQELKLMEVFIWKI